MSNYKPYFKYLGDLNNKLILILYAVLFINTATSVWGSITMSENYKEAIIFTSQSTTMGTMICMILGLFYSLMIFSQLMSIRADRVGFIKAAIYWGVILGLGLGVFGYILDEGCKMIIELCTGRNVEIFSRINWINAGSMSFGTTLVSRILTNLILFSTGFMLGAIWYRLKVKYSILIFVVMPIVVVTYAANYGFRNPDKVEAFGLKMLHILEYLMINQQVSNSLKVLGIFTFILVGIRLLVKAPIKEYANDLI